MFVFVGHPVVFGLSVCTSVYPIMSNMVTHIVINKCIVTMGGISSYLIENLIYYRETNI